MYLRGFVLSQDPIASPGFVEFPIEGAYFAYHPALQVRRIGRTILAGRAINVTGAELSIENLDDICGRFVWIELDPFRIRNDAGGMHEVQMSAYRKATIQCATPQPVLAAIECGVRP